MKNIYKSTLVFMALIWSLSLYAQQPQYYRQSGSGGNAIPFYPSYSTYKSQYYNAFTEFNAVPPSGMVITTFYVRAGSTGSASYTNLRIGMAQVPASVTGLSSGNWVPTTNVYTQSPTLNGVTGGWVTFVLDAPFPFDPTMGWVWDACMDAGSGTGFTVYTPGGTNRRTYNSSGGCNSTANSGIDGTWPDVGFDIAPAPTNVPKVPPLANFLNMNNADTLWVNSPSILVNTSSYADTNYWAITGYNATTPNGTWAAYSNPNDVLQTNARGTWLDTVANKTNLYYTFTQPGYYRIRLFTGNKYGTSFVEKPVYVSVATSKPKAIFFASKRTMAVYDRSQFNDLSSGGPTKWKWWLDPPCYTCGLYKNEFFFNGTKNDSVPNPYVVAADAGMYTVCLAVSNSRGADTLCQKTYLKVVPGYQMCNGSDSVGTTAEGAVMPTLGGATQVQYIANGCSQGFRIAPCADTIIVSLDRLRLRNNGGPLAPGDSLFLKTGILPGATILRRWGGNDISLIKDSLKSIKFVGSQLFVVYSPVAPQGPATLVNDSGFLIRWTSTAATYSKPKAAFTCPDTVYSGYKVVFQNTSTGKNQTYAWDLNNDFIYGRDKISQGIDSTNLSPSLIYNVSTATSKTVCLRTYNCVGSDTTCKTFLVLPTNIAPFADFTANKTYGLTSDSFQLIDQSFNGANAWKWRIEPSNYTFLGGTDSTSQNPMMFLNTNTSYTVTLTSSNSFGSSIKKKTNFITTISYPSPGSQFSPTSSVEDFGITRVRLNGSIGRIDTITPLKPTDGSAYTPLFNLSKTTVYRGGKYTVEVYRGANPQDSMNLRVWIDYNRNANYLDAGETIISEDRQLKVKYSATFTVPQDASIGVSRMLVGASAGFSTITPYSSTLGVYEELGIIIGRDIIKPTIKLKGSAVAKTELGKIYIDSGATASDNIEGDITSRLVAINNVDISHVGYYTVKYYVADNYGNISDTVVRTVQVEVNQTGPTITMLGSDTVTLEVRKDSYVDQGATAKDNTGVDITNSMITTNDLDTSNVGIYHYTYTVADAFGFISTKQRTINVKDSEKPVIFTRTTDNTDNIIHQIKTPFDDNVYLRVADNYWTNITPTRIAGVIDIEKAGTYVLSYQATDGSGNVSAIRTINVTVTNTFKPVINLVGGSDIIIKVFNSYKDPLAVATDYFNSPVQVQILNDNLNINIVGDYSRTYQAKDNFGQHNEVSRNLAVRDLDAPVITVLGENPISFVVGSKTKEEIAALVNSNPLSIKVVDNYDTKPVVKDNTSNIPFDKSGTYVVTYTATDSSGNKAQQKQRFVQILPNTGLNQLQGQTNVLNVYPNPSKGIFNVELKHSDIRSIKVYNIAGVLVKEVSTEKNISSYQIDLSSESEGMYLVRIEATDKVYTSKVNINR